MSFLQTELGRLLLFWAMISIPCAMMLVLVWYFRMGDKHMVRRTLVYFSVIFLVLPLGVALTYKSSPSLAKMAFLTFFILGTGVYFGLTVVATLRPRS